MKPRLQAIDISRRYGGVAALDSVSLDVRDGTVHCLLGGNGAGKSTLIRILTGVDVPSAGSIGVNGEPVRFNSPRAARAAGIAAVHQDLGLVPLMNVWRNFVLGAEPKTALRTLNVKAARASTRVALETFSISVDIERPIANLSGGERQILAIARAIHSGGKVLILDEPTAALAVDQATRVLDAIRTARANGIAVLFVTHNPKHALEVGDHVTVLRRGTVALHTDAHLLSDRDLAALITT